MIRGRAASSTGASAVAILAGAPLCGGGIGVLALARDRRNGIEHLGGHVAWQRVDHTRQV